MNSLVLLLLVYLFEVTNSQFILVAGSKCSLYTNENDCITNSKDTCVWCSNNNTINILDLCYSSNPCTNKINYKYNFTCNNIIKGSNYSKCDQYLEFDFWMFCTISFMLCITTMVCGYTCFRYYFKYRTKNNRLIGVIGISNLFLSILYILITIILSILYYTNNGKYALTVYNNILIVIVLEVITFITVFLCFILSLSVHSILIHYRLKQYSNNNDDDYYDINDNYEEQNWD